MKINSLNVPPTQTRQCQLEPLIRMKTGFNPVSVSPSLMFAQARLDGILHLCTAPNLHHSGPSKY